MEKTKRGEKEREEEREVIEGEPVTERQSEGADSKPITVTRDKSTAPADDRRRDGRGTEEG